MNYFVSYSEFDNGEFKTYYTRTCSTLFEAEDVFEGLVSSIQHTRSDVKLTVQIKDTDGEVLLEMEG